MFTLDNYRQAGETDPILIAPRVWWVGNHRQGDLFQAHSYLIEAGDQSVLIDPGSGLNFWQTLHKVEKVLPFDHIRYFVCHHSDPDISAALPLIDRRVRRDDACVVTHWRSAELLKHYDVTIPFWCVEANGWHLRAGDRDLRFVFTPYAHFPGAFTTFDEPTGVLFSSDLFGGHTEGFALVAEDEGYFEALRPFHEHYMPSREVLFNAMARIQEHDVQVIAPQHGSIIRGPLIRFMIEKLKSLECGLFLLSNRSTNIARLSLLDKVLRETLRAMTMYRELDSIAVELTSLIAQVIPVEAIEFFALTHEEGVLHFSPPDRYRGVACTPPAPVAHILGTKWLSGSGESRHLVQARLAFDDEQRPALIVALPSRADDSINFVAAIVLAGDIEIDDHIVTMIDRMEAPLQVAVERETLYRVLDLEKQKIYQMSVRDPLTACYNRIYMRDVLARQFEMQDRGQEGIGTTVIMYDIDHFKAINDTYGHNQGDVVLRAIGKLLLDNVRGGDLAVRLGGEEFAVFTFSSNGNGGIALAERIRAAIEALSFGEALNHHVVTISGGVAFRQRGEPLEKLLGRADRALYRAKRQGRNRIVVSGSPDGSAAGRKPGVTAVS